MASFTSAFLFFHVYNLVFHSAELIVEVHMTDIWIGACGNSGKVFIFVLQQFDKKKFKV